MSPDADAAVPPPSARALAWLAGGTAALIFIRIPGVPLAEIALGLWAVAWTAGGGWRDLPRVRGAPVCAALAAAWAAASLVGGVDVPALAAVARMGIVFLAAPVVFQRGLDADARPALTGAGAGWLVCVVLALVQRLVGAAPEEVGGTLDARVLYGVAVACAAPVALSAAARLVPAGPATARRRALVAAAGALGVVVPASTVLYLPALVLFCLAAIAWGVWCAPPAARPGGVAAAALVLVTAIVAPGTWGGALGESVATTDADGLARRWTLELRAGLAAIGARPVLGHGPGSYQEVVSGAEYRGVLPDTAEPRVERGMQCGYLVLAVEHGVPAAVLVAAALALGLWSALRTSRDRARGGDERARAGSAAVSLGALMLGVCIAQPLVEGTGLLVALALGLAASAAMPVTLRRARWLACARRAVAQAAVVVVAGLVGAAAGVGAETTPGAAQLSGTGQRVVLRAAGVGVLPPHLLRIDDPLAAGGAALAVPEAERRALVACAGARYDFTLALPGTFRVWVRGWWQDGCGNSFAVAVDGGRPALVGNDGTYRAWHWVAGPVLALPAGGHVLALLPRERGARVDQILLTDDADLYPSGILDAGGAPGSGVDHRAPAAERGARDGPAPAPDRTGPAPAAGGALPVWRSEGRAPRAPFSGAVGGAYRGGPESFFVGLGIPCARLRDDELTDAAALGRYGVVWISAPQFRPELAWKAVHAYVTGGGTAIVEKMNERRPWTPATPEESELLDGRKMQELARHGLSVRAAGSPFFAGVADGTGLPHDVVCWEAGRAPWRGTSESHGELVRFRQPLGPVFVKRRVGDGTLFALAVPVGFHSMWRGTALDPIGVRILRDAVAGRYAPLYAEFRQAPGPAGTVQFADDFMREAGQGSQWKVERGTFSLTGARPADQTMAFALRSRGPCSAATGDPAWSAYRLAVAVLADRGEGGLWVTTSGARRLMLLYDGARGRLSLQERAPDGADAGATLLAEAQADAPHDGWRRVSLFARDGRWQGWLDGVPALGAPAGAQTPSGRFGVAATGGEVYYDDIRACDVAALVEGCDTCLGEEGSPRAWPPRQDGLEPRAIYAPQWLLRPDPSARHAVRVPLPVPGGATFAVDGRALGTVPEDADGPLVYLPEGVVPHTDIALVCPRWRDYAFGGRLVEWYATGARWTRMPRWACDPEWEWLGTDASGTAILWCRARLAPPYCVHVLVAPSADEAAGRERGRDLNLVLGGNGTDLAAGLTIRTGPYGAPGIELWRDGARLARAEKTGLPSGHSLHHRWFELIAVVDAGRVRFTYEGALVFDEALAAPLLTGRVGVWTEDNAVRIARATIVGGR